MKNKIKYTAAIVSYIFLIAVLIAGCKGDVTQNKETVVSPANDSTIVTREKEPLKLKLHLSMSISDIPFPFEILD